MAQALTAYLEREKGPLLVTLAELDGQGSGQSDLEPFESSAELLELARGIEPPTCGLQNRCSAD